MSENVDWSPEGLTSVQTGAVAMHEMYKGLTYAGFTEQQALYLVAQMVNRPKTEGS